jgi:D-xylose transport system ATP-binding protein
MDEPTTALSEQEVLKLMSIIRELKTSGVTIIYISHKLNEVISLADRVSVMRDGQYIATKNMAGITESELVKLMVGREITDFYPKGIHRRGEVVLSVKDFTLYDTEIEGRRKIDGVTFDIYKGEILGIAGLMGSGRTELLNGIFGAWEGKKAGELICKGEKQNFNMPEEAIKNGIGFVPEDRKRLGLLLDKSIGINLNLASLQEVASGGIVNQSLEIKRSNEIVEKLGIKCSNIDVEANTLSGGNQQKVVIGKWLLTNPDILFLDEPTRGVDVGAKAEIYTIINTLVEKGVAIVMVSSDLPEVIGMSDRILVLHAGKLTAEFPGRTTSQEEIMTAATGNLKPNLP